MGDDETDRADDDTGQEDPFAAAKRAAYEAAAARAEPRGSSGVLTGCLILAAVIVLPAFLYFGLFAVLMGEELLLGSGWFRENLPASVLEFLRVIYLPLLWLMDQFDG